MMSTCSELFGRDRWNARAASLIGSTTVVLSESRPCRSREAGLGESVSMPVMCSSAVSSKPRKSPTRTKNRATE